MIVHAKGSNRDHEAKLACEMAGGEAEIVHINQLAAGERQILDYQMLILPGGFSYGDDLGAGVLWAQDLRQRFIDQIQGFVEAGRPVLGICNGFQALVKSGLLPGGDFSLEPSVTLTYNESGHFECRWVYLKPNPQSPSLFTDGLTELIYCPVAHGEGRLLTCDEATTQALWDQGLVTLSYVDATGSGAAYPANPNGSVAGIASLCNPAGNVMGLMPHPEDHIFSWQHPRWHRGEFGLLGLSLIQNGIRHA
jgi:phosphoribosylformylglycinamidine synthase